MSKKTITYIAIAGAAILIYMYWKSMRTASVAGSTAGTDIGTAGLSGSIDTGNAGATNG